MKEIETMTDENENEPTPEEILANRQKEMALEAASIEALAECARALHEQLGVADPHGADADRLRERVVDSLAELMLPTRETPGERFARAITETARDLAPIYGPLIQAAIGSAGPRADPSFERGCCTLGDIRPTYVGGHVVADPRYNPGGRGMVEPPGATITAASLENFVPKGAEVHFTNEALIAIQRRCSAEAMRRIYGVPDLGEAIRQTVGDQRPPPPEFRTSPFGHPQAGPPISGAVAPPLDDDPNG